MNFSSGLTVSVVGVFAGWLSIVAPACAQSRAVVLTVTVNAPNGNPVAGLPVCVDTAAGEAGAQTNEQGAASVSVIVGPAESRVPVRFEAGCAHVGGVARLREVIATMAVKSVYWADIPLTGTTAALTISLREAVFVSGRFLDETGQPLGCTVGVREARAFARTSPDGRFRVPVRRQARSDVFALFSDGRVKAVAVAELTQDLDLGDVQVAAAAADAPTRVTLAAADQVNQTVESKGSAVSLIAADATRILTFPAKDSLVVSNPGTGALPSVHAGTYYVVPGRFGNSLSWRVLDAVRAGVNLDQAGIPKIVAVVGQETALTISVPQAEAAINALPAPPGNP